MKWALSLILICSVAASGATITAATASRADVGTAVSSAVDGDTVVIPSGNVAWISKLTISAAITLQGNGVGSTIIKDQIPDANADGLTDAQLIEWVLVANKTSRMTAIEFQDGNVNSVNYNGVITVAGANTDSRQFRCDHCTFRELQGANIFLSDVIGVIDHCTFTNNTSRIPIYVYHENWNGVANSDGSWADTDHWGTANFLFIEDSVFQFPNGTPYAITDAYRGARYVVRYNVITNGWIEMHGTDSGGRKRGTRAVEIYKNTFGGDDSTSYTLNCRSGAVLIWSNNVYGHTASPQLHLDAYRRFYPFSPWGQADGTNAWDVNTAGAQASGTVTSAGTLTMTDNTKTWTVSQWVGYQVNLLTGGPAEHSSTITANTATQLTFANDGGYGSNLSFANGNAYDIRQVLQAIDQPGRSGGTQLSGTTPSVPAGWNDQVTDPCYEWSNSGPSSFNINFTSAASFIRSNEHYYNDTQAPGYAPYTYPHPLQGQVAYGATIGTAAIGKGNSQ